VNPTLTSTDRPAAVTLRYFFWSHPEWWSVGLSGLAWAVMLLHGWQYGGHGVHHRMTVTQETSYWMLMVAAMMLPLLIYAVRFTAFASLWNRRHRSIAGFLLGYFAPWLLLGIVAGALRQASWTHTYAVPALGFAAAALWQRTAMHRRALRACHRSRPLAPLGWRADRDCLRFGGLIGVACVRTCWPLMLACVFAGHGPIAMAGGMVVGALERWPYRPRMRTALLATLALASYYVVLTVLDQGFAIAV
jgi:Predicted metal-binding integral membrane protein (DUF2182)